MDTPTDRLLLLYDLAREVTTFTDLDSLLRHATRRTRELLDAEGCTVLLLDDAGERLFFPVSSQIESRAETSARLEELSFPADQGVAGWVLKHDEATLVDDTASDPRFYPGVDREAGSTTRTLLCAPLRTRAGNIGVVEVINPARGRFTEDDVALLEGIAGDVAVACEKARLYDRLRHETLGLRQVCRFAGIGLVVVGLVFALGGIYAHLARALPLRELSARPAPWTGALLLAVGAALVAVARGWVVPSAPEPSLPSVGPARRR